MRFRSTFPELRVPFYRDLGDALEQGLDAVHVVTSAPSHVSIAKAVVRSGFEGALLIEKPVSNSVAEADGLVELMRSLDWKGRAAVDYHRRCSKLYAGIEHSIRSGEYGKLLGVEFSRACKLSMNGAHFVDLANWFIDAAPVSVAAELDEHSTLDHRGAFFFDPAGKVEVTYQNGLKFELDARGKADVAARGITVHLENADLRVNDVESLLEIRTPAGTRTLPSDREANALNWVETTLLSLLDPATGYSPCSIGHSLDSLAVIVAAHLSDRDGGRAITLPLEAHARRTVLRVA
jgi:predicted dehydrogenase